jgi:hypothetical protein
MTPQARVDPHIITRDVGQQDALLLLRALADESLTQSELVREMLALLIAISSLIAQHRSPPSSGVTTVRGFRRLVH